MRIQNNIMAMNTHRFYTANNNAVSKSAEKLSSGYRVNRAGDDAAGLAISEKMRAEIRGLSMASKNSQDGVSMVQTAEGALQEVHSMLQRMNELAVQSASGTNDTGVDRAALQQEFKNLQDEIDQIASATKALIVALTDKAEQYADAIMPGYTHLQRAQPITFGHHLMAYSMMLLRDLDRLADCKRRMNQSPIGCCALAGTTYDTDRYFEAEKLGFDGICLNSLDGVSDRDF